MNYQDMASFVRTHADTDADDAPDATLRIYARAAYNDVRRRVFPWPDKKTTFTFLTVPGQEFYPYALMTAPDLEFVISVTAPDTVLGYISPEQFTSRIPYSHTGSPAVYSADVTGLRLHPTPTASETVTVTGYRKFAEWPLNDADEPDLNRAFDEVICWYMLSKYYSAQEDLELAQIYLNDYEMTLSRQIEAQLRGSGTTAGPTIFGNQTLENFWNPPTRIVIDS